MHPRVKNLVHVTFIYRSVGARVLHLLVNSRHPGPGLREGSIFCYWQHALVPYCGRSLLAIASSLWQVRKHYPKQSVYA